MKKLAILVLLTFGLVGCGNSKPDLTKEIIIGSFASAGFVGEEVKKGYQMIGAIDGFGLRSDDFSVELYKFETEERANSHSFCEFTNDEWCMLLHRDGRPPEVSKKIVKVFEEL